MKIRYPIVAPVLLALLAGCGEGGGSGAAAQAEDATNSVKTATDHVWSGQVEALDKAKQVGQNLMDAAERQRQDITSQSR